MNFIKKYRKVLAIISAATITVLFLLFALGCIFISGGEPYGSRVRVDRQRREIHYTGSEISILQLSDIQTSNLVECAMAYPTVKWSVARTRPDLIVLTGDNISNGSGNGVLDAFINLMDSFKIPWAPVLGNHDPNSAVPIEQLCERLEASEYCLFDTGDIQNRYGNYSYTLVNDGVATETLIFMDSGKEGFTEEQVRWYEDTLLESEKKYSHTPSSLVFFHIPIKETLKAHEAYADDPEIGSGEARSEVRVQSLDSGFFDAVIRLGSTRGLFYGHDHENNTQILYRGVLFCYGTKTGITVYFSKDSLGANLLTLGRDGELEVERINC